MQILKDEFPVWTVSITEYCQKNHCNICQRNQPATSQKTGQPSSVIKRQKECPSKAFLYQIPPWRQIMSRTRRKQDSRCDLLPFPSYPNKPIISSRVKVPLVLSSKDTWKQQRKHTLGSNKFETHSALPKDALICVQPRCYFPRISELTELTSLAKCPQQTCKDRVMMAMTSH